MKNVLTIAAAAALTFGLGATSVSAQDSGCTGCTTTTTTDGSGIQMSSMNPGDLGSPTTSIAATVWGKSVSDLFAGGVADGDGNETTSETYGLTDEKWQIGVDTNLRSDLNCPETECGVNYLGVGVIGQAKLEAGALNSAWSDGGPAQSAARTRTESVFEHKIGASNWQTPN